MEKQEKKAGFFLRLTGYLAIVFMFIVCLMDRELHILLPHREHPQFTAWAKDPTNVKYAFSRLFIFSLPIIIFKLIV